jgi:hypothetical protein
MIVNSLPSPSRITVFAKMGCRSHKLDSPDTRDKNQWRSRRTTTRSRHHHHLQVRPLFWLFVIAFNLVGTGDILLDYYHAVHVGLPALAGQLGAAYAIPILYVPMLMITHIVAFYWLVRPQPKAARVLISDSTES